MEHQINKHENKPLKTFSLANRFEFKQIRNVENHDLIKQQLMMAFTLTGLKGQFVPDGTDKMVLINFIIEDYNDLYPQEITTAFKLLIKRKLELDEKQIPHYNDFSCEYFGRIMNAYRKHRNKELKRIIDTKHSEIKTINMSDHAYLKTSLFDKYDKIVNGLAYTSQFSKLDGYILYNKLETIGVEICTKEARQTMWNEIRTDLVWFKAKNDKRKPTVEDAKNECKHQLFKDWILNCSKDQVNIMSLITDKLSN